MNGQQAETVRERLERQQAQIDRLRAELEEVKADLSLIFTALGWDPGDLKFPAGDS